MNLFKILNTVYKIFKYLLGFTSKNIVLMIILFIIFTIFYCAICEIERKNRVKDFLYIDDFLKLPNEKISGCYVILVYDKPLSKDNLNYQHVYVGQSIDLYRRVKTHLSGNGCEKIFWDNKKKKYIYVRLFKAKKGTLDRLEKHLIKRYNAFYSKKGYNKTRGGGGYYGKFRFRKKKR